MIQSNYAYLTEVLLPKMGFPRVFDEAIKPQMEAGVEKIQIKAEETVDKKKFAYEITLDKRPNDMYFLNKIRGSVTDESGNTVSQDFPLRKQQGFFKAEIANLLQGQSVYSTYFDSSNQRHANWTWIDFSKQKENGNFAFRTRNDLNHEFRLVKEISKINPTMMTAEQKEDTLRSIMKGNRTPIFLNLGNDKVKMFVEVDARRLALNVYDGKGVKVDIVKEKTGLSIVVPEEKKDLSNSASEGKPNLTDAKNILTKSGEQTAKEPRKKIG